MKRREFIGATLASQLSSLPAAVRGFRWAVCSETFPGKPFAEICDLTRRTNYTGLEIDPSNLSDDPAALSAPQRAVFKKTMRERGVEYVGLHAFLKAPKGLHLTTPDAGVRRRSWDYFDRLIDLAADLGDRPVMVLGSSKQRQAIEGATPTEAVERLTGGLARLAPHAERTGVTILMEPLAPHLCNLVNSMDEAAAIVNKIGSRAVQSMFDTHNTPAETLPLPEVIRKHFSRIRHVHLNELNGKYPGSGTFAFSPVLKALRDLNYRGWLSVEVFDFQPDGETVARNAASHLQRLEREL
ncbi:MAG: sugar phosphate isomerase/epimerase family protein [Bryobacteraceae bacterium]